MAYSFTTVDFTPADTPPFTELLGINDAANKIVGVHNQTNQAFFFVPSSTFTNFTPTGAVTSTATGINNGGEIVGFFVDASGTTHGFTDINGIFTTTDESGTAFNQLLGVNDKGQIAGYSSDIKNGLTDQLAYLRQANGTYTMIDNAGHTADLPTNVNSQATGVDNAGDVVGFYMPTATTSDGFLLAAGSTKPFTLQFPGATFTQALGINNNGEIVGFYNDANGNAHGFVYSIAGGTYTDISDPGATMTTINRLNDQGEAVGFEVDAAGNTHGLTVNLPQLVVTDTSKGTTWQQTADSYTGPVSGLTGQYINVTSDNLNLTALSDNLFLHTGAGEDAIQALGGNNVLDGGTGSNFLVDGTGTDTDFLDARNATAPIWSTLVNFHSADSATLWGITQAGFNINWQNNQGAAGFTGLTGTLTSAGKPTVSITLTGYTTADLSNGRLSVSFGTDPASGSPFMFIHAT